MEPTRHRQRRIDSRGAFAQGLARAVAIAFALALLPSPQTALAGSLCGTVRDAATLAPVANAGVFLRETTGAYTGFNTSTSAAGKFCLNFVPPGVYDLEILRDDYRIAYLKNITVTGVVVDVPVDVVGLGLELRKPYPSPAESQVTFSWVMPAPGSARLAVFDARGRLMSAWASRDLSLGLKSVAWDLRDSRGRRVPAGVYYLRLESGAERRVRRFVCLP